MSAASPFGGEPGDDPVQVSAIMPPAMSAPLGSLGAPPRQHRSPAIALDAKVRDAVSRDGVERADLPVVAEDQRAGLIHPAARRAAWRRDIRARCAEPLEHRHRWGTEVGLRTKLSLGCSWCTLVAQPDAHKMSANAARAAAGPQGGIARIGLQGTGTR